MLTHPDARLHTAGLQVSAPSIRGVMGTAHQLLIVTGCLTGCLVGIPWAGDWRRLSWAGIPIPGVLLLLISIMPQSPRWLASKGRIKEARRSLIRLRGGESPAVDRELQEIQDAIAGPTTTARSGSVSGSERGGVYAIIGARESKVAPPGGVGCCGPALKATFISVTLMLCQQFSGIGAVLFYGGELLSKAGISNPNLGAAISQMVQFVFTMVAVLLIDRVGRRPLLLTSVRMTLMHAHLPHARTPVTCTHTCYMHTHLLHARTHSLTHARTHAHVHARVRAFAHAHEW